MKRSAPQQVKTVSTYRHYKKASKNPAGPLVVSLFASALLLGSCVNTPSKETAQTGTVAARPGKVSQVPQRTQSAPPTAAEPGAPTAPAARPAPASHTAPVVVHKGTGRFIDESAALQGIVAAPDTGDIVLNFQNTAIEDVTKVIMGDMLNENYVLDPEVKGTISLQTSKPMKRDSLLPLFEELLRLNGAALIREDQVYRIVPQKKAAASLRAPRLRNAQQKLPPGYQTFVVPLSYIAADEMKAILDPFVSDGAVLSVNKQRNLLMLAGTSLELQNWLETVEIFDVDWMKGNSVALIPLEQVDASKIVGELRKILGGETDGQQLSLIRLEPIDRLNAVLVITPQPRYLDDVRQWIKRLDHAVVGPGIRLYVYRVKNRKATDLATVLSAMFDRTESSSASQPVKLAPGATPATIESPTAARPLPLIGSTGPDSTYAAKDSQAMAQLVSDVGQSIKSDDTGLPLPQNTSIRIMADDLNNSIVVMATSSEYKIVEAALQRLDIVPLQVLIEASIVEVQLTGNLEYGVEWFFKNDSIQNKTGVGTLDLGAAGIAAKAPGFSYALLDAAGNIHAVLNLLAKESKLNVLSSPSLMVLDNRTAEIRVGNQVPVQTETAVTDGGVTVESIQFKDTGVLLSVTPGVNEGGLVTMDVSQEVTDVGPIDAATGQRTFLQRNIQSVVAVQSGATIVLGGLILENESEAESGIPGLYKIPGIGKLFGQTESSSFRTELLVLITPKVIKNQGDANDITDEFRKRMKHMEKWPIDEAPKPPTIDDEPALPQGSAGKGST